MLSCQRHLFSLPADLHYLNCAYMSPLARRVEEAGIHGMLRKRSPADIHPQDFFNDIEEVRTLFARLIGAPDPGRIAVIPSVSYGLATAANNLAVEPGQNVVLASEQFPSNVYAWRRLAGDRGLELRTVAAPRRADRRGDAWNSRLLEAIDEHTALVALGQVHWADGTLFDITSIGERARQVGAAVVVDGTQSVGAMPFDVMALEPDAVVCAGYKWLMGPYSIGAAYYGSRFDDGRPLEETWIARPESHDFRRLVEYRAGYRAGAVRYDVGETSNFILVPMLLAALTLVAEWGVPAIQEYCGSLTQRLVAQAAGHGFVAEDPAWRAGHIVGLRLPAGLDASAVSSKLASRNVSVSVRGEVLRVSPHVYNDAGDVDALAVALGEIVANPAA